MRPKRVGPYRLIDLLGAGGMGDVFRAYDERLKRWVAVKQVRLDDEDPQRGKRFRREAQATAVVNHPAIVQIHDVLATGDGEWIVMEYVEGKTLASLLRGGPLPLARALPLARQIAEGLAAAHARGIIHRDLKTENVMVTPAAKVKILDFGLAKRFRVDGYDSTDPDTWKSLAGRIVGTSRAMSPEQAQGLELDYRTDLFSLGTLLFEMLTGTSPFKGSSHIDTMNRVCTYQQPPARDLNGEVPWRLSELFRLDHESILPAFPGYKVASVAEDSTGEVWFGTTDGLFRLVGENLETVTLPRNSGAVNVVKNLEGELWVGTTQKAYRQSRTEFAPVAIDNGQINVTNSRSEINVKGFTKSGSEIWVWSTEGAYLFDDRAGPWKTGLGTTFLWWLLAWVVLLFAPWFKPAMRFVMSSLLRGYLSVGAIPIALLFDFTRRHLFRRYVSKIREAPEYPDTDLGISSRGLDFGKELTLESPKLLLVGKTADTERYLKYITGRLAQRKHGYRSLRKTIPVFINAATDVEGTERKDLEIAAARALLLGNFTDEDLAIKTFKEGGFVFLINGLLGDDYRAIEAFANQYANCGNFVVVATESAANQLKGFPEAVSWERTGKLLNL